MPKKKDRRRRFGTVVRRPRDGGGYRYQARWTTNGKRTERTFDTRDEADEFLVELEKKTIVGQTVAVPTLREMETSEAVRSAPTPTFVEYAKKLYDERISKTKAPGTVALYGHNLAALSEYFGQRVVDGVTLPSRRLDEITPDIVEDYWIWRRDRPRVERAGLTSVGNASLNRDAQFLKLVVAHAAARGLIPENRLRGMDELPEPQQARRYLERSEAALLIDKCDDRFRAVVVTALFTGMRSSELKGLTWNDVNLESGKLAIFRRKTGKPDWIDLHPKVAAEFTRIRTERPNAAADEHIFLSRRGAPWADFRAAWRRALTKAKFLGRKGLTFHSLRHTFAVHFHAGGGRIVNLQAQLGHADIATTMIYAAMVDEQRREDVLRMDYGQAPKDADVPCVSEMGDWKGDWSARERRNHSGAFLVRCA